MRNKFSELLKINSLSETTVSQAQPAFICLHSAKSTVNKV